MEKSSTISVLELKKRLAGKRVEFLFDLRNQEDFNSWQIEGRDDIETLNIPQEDFVGDEDRFLSRIPKRRRIVTVCAHGDSSSYVAILLQSRGINAVSLQGGMDAWSEFYETHKVRDDPAIYQIYRVARGCLAYLVISGGIAIVIDAARHVNRIQDLATSLNVRIANVLDTHLHADHISGV